IGEVTVLGAWQNGVAATASNIEAGADKASGVSQLAIACIEVDVKAAATGVHHRRLGQDSVAEVFETVEAVFLRALHIDVEHPSTRRFTGRRADPGAWPKRPPAFNDCGVQARIVKPARG